MRLRYQCHTVGPLLDAGRKDLEQALDTNFETNLHRIFLTSFEPPTNESNIVVAEVGDRTQVELTIKGETRRQVSFTFGYISNVAHRYVYEFIENTRRGEPFSIEIGNERGHIQNYDAFRVDDARTRYLNSCDGFTFTTTATILE